MPLAARGFALRDETADDLPFLRQLFLWERWPMFADLPLPADQKTALINGQFDLQHRQYAANHPGARFLILSDAAGPVGRICVADSAGDLLLVDVLIRPDRRGQGIGAALLGGLVDTARAQGCGVRLRVHKGNPAQALYERLGFRTVADDDVAVRMEWRA